MRRVTVEHTSNYWYNISHHGVKKSDAFLKPAAACKPSDCQLAEHVSAKFAATSSVYAATSYTSEESLSLEESTSSVGSSS
jgi:hypothetical protein